ncbi:hypothetical protein P280DRAFT_142296 [Massarina eburnea CBS 473.64]|uniref:Uncharacterized protein n=1 Tax=Massarina eburnea CBS 473.64 TaxID=1395130 RepID=A0A6A6RQG8_9PLEO|nr:hypothetical protein P280DRAFT_142296 [Massarina eburnea CBS 473.64]
MSAVSSSTTSTAPADPEPPHPVLNLHPPLRPALKLHTGRNESDVISPQKPVLSRHYTTLQEHADAVRKDNVTPEEGSDTPRVEGRREGFMWEARKEEALFSIAPRPLPTPTTPPSLDHILQARASMEEGTTSRGHSINSMNSGPSRSSTSLSGASFPGGVSRTDTARSSLSGLARGVVKHIPDMSMFLPIEKDIGVREDVYGRSGHKKSKPPKLAFSDAPAVELPEIKSKSTSPVRPTSKSRGTLQDRRKAAMGDAMKLTLPQNMPQLPSRGRMPASDLSSIAPSRPRSPKTPWVTDRTAILHTVEPPSAPPTIPEDVSAEIFPGNDLVTSSTTPQTGTQNKRIGLLSRRSGGRVRFGRQHSSGGTRTSNDDSQASSPSLAVTSPHFDNLVTLHTHDQTHTQEQETQTQQDLRELGKRSRAGRWRWSGRRSSNDIDTPPPTSPDRTPFFLTRFLQNKRSTDSSSTLASTPTQKSFWRRKQSIPARPASEHMASDFIDNMPVPPYFVPPGLQRVPTPPIHDARSEVKGKLNDFFFEMQGGGRTHKAVKSPGSIWDSDAILMSQQTISSPSTESDESPQAPSGNKDAAPGPTPLTAYLNVPLSPISPPLSGPSSSPPKATQAEIETWFRVQAPTGESPPLSSSTSPNHAVVRLAEEKAKLEWITPEHLPASPLCPLHEKYRGPSKGMCIFHGKKKSVWETAAAGKGKDNSLRRESILLRRESLFDGVVENVVRSRRSMRKADRVSSS